MLPLNNYKKKNQTTLQFWNSHFKCRLSLSRFEFVFYYCLNLGSVCILRMTWGATERVLFLFYLFYPMLKSWNILKRQVSLDGDSEAFSSNSRAAPQSPPESEMWTTGHYLNNMLSLLSCIIVIWSMVLPNHSSCHWSVEWQTRRIRQGDVMEM